VDGHSLDDEFAAGTAQDVFAVLLEHFHKAAAYGAETGDADDDLSGHGILWFGVGIMEEAEGGAWHLRGAGLPQRDSPIT
jgi:hypothetical protein